MSFVISGCFDHRIFLAQLITVVSLLANGRGMAIRIKRYGLFVDSFFGNKVGGLKIEGANFDRDINFF